MIQTHLLPSQPPYQIISSRGLLGVQVATLVIVEHTLDEKEGVYRMETHSHPVVNYGNKEIVRQKPERYVNDPYSQPEEWVMQPEGAVWDKVEISDVTVIGFAGITRYMTLEQYLELTSAKSDFGDIWPWTKFSSRKAMQLNRDLLKMGMGTNFNLEIEDDEPVRLYLDCFNFASNRALTVQLCLGFTDSRPLYSFTSESESTDKDMALEIGECINVLIRANNMTTGANKRWDWDKLVSVELGSIPNDEVPGDIISRIKDIAAQVQEKHNDHPF